MFSVMVLEVLLPTRAACGLLIRRSSSHLHREVLRLDGINGYLLKALYSDGSECERAVVFVAGGRRLLRKRDHGGGFEARRDTWMG